MDESFHNGKAIIWQIRDVCCNAFLEGGTFVLWPAEATGLIFGSFLLAFNSSVNTTVVLTVLGPAI